MSPNKKIKKTRIKPISVPGSAHDRVVPGSAHASHGPARGIVTDELLLEIGTEEMPANYLAYAEDPENRLFERAFQETLKKFEPLGLRSTGTVKVYLTPRRIVWHVQKISFDLTPVALKVPGPSLEQAFTSDKKPTPALMGFLKSKGSRPEDAVEMEHRGKRCVGIERRETPKPFEHYLVNEAQIGRAHV